MALLFDANTELVDHGSLTLNDPFTFVALVNPSTVTDANRQLAGHTVSSGNHRLMTSASGAAGRCRCLVIQSTAFADAQADIVTTGWQWLAFRYDSGDSQRCRIYRATLTGAWAEAGTYASTTNGSGTMAAATGNMFIGSDPTSSFGFAGDLEFAGLWNRALTLDELEIVRATFGRWPRVSQQLRTLYGRGTSTQFDLSGNDNDGSITGATASEGPAIRRLPSVAQWYRPYIAPGGSPALSSSNNAVACA